MTTTPMKAENLSADSFTMEKLNAAMRLIGAMPPAPVLASWSEFPRDHAIRFTDEGREYVGAHPDFWKQIPASSRGQYQSIAAVEIIDLSLSCYADEKAKFLLAMGRATKALLAQRSTTNG